MKKFSILIAILLCVTIGGVYAAWMFADSNDAALKTTNVSLTLTDDIDAGAYGTYTLTASVDNAEAGTKAFALYIDDIDDGITHNAVLVGEGNLTITFTPNESAIGEVREGATPTYWCIKAGDAIANWKYEDKAIFTSLDETWKTIDGVNADNWVKSADGKSFTYVITGAEIANMLTLNDFILETKAEYNAFTTALTYTKLTLYVNDSQTTT